MSQKRRRESWGFAEGEEFAPGRIALASLGGGWDYEAYLGWDEHLQALVVFKLVRPHLVGDEHVLRSLRREAEMLSRLNHPVIVRCFGAVLEGDRPHIVLEHLEGPSLAAALRETEVLALEQLVPLAFQLASAVQYLANEGIVHLDVKPGNVILGAPPRLVDFSIARPVGEAARLRRPVGTDAYMAPEQCDPGRGPVGPAADVWGIGATLYEAAVGRVPFPRPRRYDEHDPFQRFPQLAGAPPEIPGDVPGPLGDLILDCLRFDPSERPSAGAVADRLEPLVGEIMPRRVLGRPRPRLR